MAATAFLLNLVLLALVLSVSCISKCDKKIVEDIMSTNNCPKSVLKTYQDNRRLVSRVLWKDSPYKCVKVEAKKGSVVDLHMTAPYKDGYRPSNGAKEAVFDFLLEDKGCGYFTKKVSDKGSIKVYYKQASDKCLSLYTCANDSSVIDGTPAPGCFFPVDKQNEDDIKKCRDDLQKSMPNVPLVIMPDCTK